MPAVRSGQAGETRNFRALISGFTAALAAVNAALAATARVTFLLADDPHDIESDTPPPDFARLMKHGSYDLIGFYEKVRAKAEEFGLAYDNEQYYEKLMQVL